MLLLLLLDDSGKTLDAAGNWQVEKIADVPVVDETQLMVATTSTPKTPEEIEKGIEKVARSMLEKGIDAETIAGVTELSLADIQKLMPENRR